MRNPTSEAHEDNVIQLIRDLEPAQMTTFASRPLPRRCMGMLGNAGLWILRGFVLLVGSLVIYTFIVGLIRNG